MPDWRADPLLADVEPRDGSHRRISAREHQLLDMPAPATTARLVKLDQGLYALDIGETGGLSGEVAGMTVPAIQISAPPSDDCDPVEIVAASGDYGPWLGPEGGTVVIRSPPGGGWVLITGYGAPDEAIAPLEVEIRRLGPSRRPADANMAPVMREIRLEIALHIELMGDRRFSGQGWAGSRGQKLRIEAFGIVPVDTLTAADIEYKAFAPTGRETPWVSDGKLCGTRGRGVPLTGFAVRLAPHLREQFDVVYQGSFFEGGVSGPTRNGQTCKSAINDDPLEAIRVDLVQRSIE